MKKGGRLGTGKLNGDWSNIIDPIKRRKAYVKEYRKQQYDRQKQSPEYVVKNRQRVREWIKNNPDKAKIGFKRWRVNNPHKINAMRERSRAIKKMLLHPLHDFKIEHDMQKMASSISAATGISHQVDHIIPLGQGGWHHHQNLQILPMVLNIKKGKNAFWYMPGYKSFMDVPANLWPEHLREQYLTKIKDET